MMVSPQETLYIQNRYDGTLSVVDVPSRSVVGSISVEGGHTDDVVASARGEVLYVSRQDRQDVIAISAEKGEVLWSVSLGGLPHHLALSQDGDHLYVAIFDERFDEVVDTKTREVIARPQTGLGSHGVFLSPNGERFYVGSQLIDTLAVVDARTLQTERVIQMDEGVRPFDITKDERRLYAQLSRLHGFVVVDLRSDAVIERVALPPLSNKTTVPREFPHTVDHGLRLTPTDDLLFVAATLESYVAVYSVPGHDLLDKIPVGKWPDWIVFSDEASLCYCTNSEDDTLSIISVAERRELDRIAVGRYPQRIAVVAR